jgi:photosystem II stability/assembly factor-like uncharacterized protein
MSDKLGLLPRTALMRAVISIAVALTSTELARATEPVFSYSGVISVPGQDLPAGRRVVVNSAGNAVIVSQEPSWLNRSGTVISWINRNGVVLDSARIDDIIPLDLALDGQDNVYISGYILPYVSLVTSGAFDACRPSELTQRRGSVVKVNAVSKQVELAACLGPGYANSVAVDSAGIIYLSGTALSDALPASPDALKSASYSWGDGYNGAVYDGFFVELTPAGQLLYSTYVGGPGHDEVTALALDSEGSVYLAGTTNSAGLGTPGSFRPNRIGSVLYRSNDQGTTWQAIGSGLPWSGVRMLARQPGSASVLYALASPSDRGTVSGIFRSSDGGNNWKYVGPNPGGFDTQEVRALLVSSNGALYAAYSLAFFRSNDGGITWTKLPVPVGDWTRLQLSADDSLYLSTTSRILLRSRDAGTSWQTIFTAAENSGVPDVSAAPSVIFLEADRKLLKSLDGGDRWTEAGPWGVSFALAVSPSNPLILYRVSGSAVLDRSNDGGINWTRWTTKQVPGQRVIIDAQNPDVLYSVDSASNQVWRLDGAGQTFVKINRALGNTPTYGLLSSREQPAELLLTTDAALDAFVIKLTADHHVSYSTYLGGYGNDYPTAIRIDSSGRTYISGFTASLDLPVPVGAYQPFLHPLDDFPGIDFTDPRLSATGRIVRYEWGTDGFLVALEADGSRLSFGTYLGGEESEIVTGIALLPDGTILACGMTSSYDFPRTDDALPLSNYRGSMTAFLVRFTPNAGGLLYATLLSGNGYQLDSWADSVAVNSDGDVYVTGFGNSRWYRTSGGQAVNGVAFVSARFPDAYDN